MSVKHDGYETLTVGELIAALQQFEPATPVKALWDTVPRFSVHRVEPFQGTALLDCGSGAYGDWWAVVQDYPEDLNDRQRAEAAQDTEP